MTGKPLFIGSYGGLRGGEVEKRNVPKVEFALILV